MQTTRVVLTEPFIKLPAGLVLELDAAMGVSGWDDDTRVRERMNFSGKRNYHLPDGGNGLPYELPLSATRPCPEGIFDGLDMKSGPLRITQSWSGYPAENLQKTNVQYDAELQEINGLNAQGILLPAAVFGGNIREITIQDMLLESPAQACAWAGCSLGLENLTPGFYQLEIILRDGNRHRLRLMKSFPLLVFFSGNFGQYSVQKTLY